MNEPIDNPSIGMTSFFSTVAGHSVWGPFNTLYALRAVSAYDRLAVPIKDIELSYLMISGRKFRRYA